MREKEGSLGLAVGGNRESETQTNESLFIIPMLKHS